ncbi:MAG: hypothetical protein QOJ09_2075 [Actinomycetota bacterium]|nr:hypothetical protein [Actinomycetota bacterium]
MADWTTISSLATAGGTLILAVATFVSTRSANRAARVAERSLLAGLRPVLVQSRLEDRTEKIGFVDNVWLRVDGGGAGVEVTDEAIYLAMSLRNVGSGLGVLHGWDVRVEDLPSMPPPLRPDEFRRLTRDLYVPAGDIALWQGAMRDHDDRVRAPLVELITKPERFAVDLLYGDHEGGQRTITRFSVIPRGDAGWFCTAVRHWNLDREDPR